MFGAVTSVAMVLALWSATPARAAREETARYVGPSDPIVAATVAVTGLATVDPVCAPFEEAPGVSGACFPVRRRESKVRVRIVDTVAQLVQGELTFVDGNGERVGDAIGFCRRVQAEIPDGAAAILVGVSQFACPPAGSTVPVGGQIVAYFE